MKRITVFETSDGQKFPNAKEAKAHESSITLDQTLTDWFKGQSHVTVEHLRNMMVGSGWELIKLLSDIARQTPQPEDEDADEIEDTELAA